MKSMLIETVDLVEPLLPRLSILGLHFASLADHSRQALQDHSCW